MKLISIGKNVYRIKDDDYISLIYAFDNFNDNTISLKLIKIEKQYRKIMKLDDMFNYR